MAMVASTHVLLAGPLLPAVPFVVRVAEPASVSRSEERGVGKESPVVAEVITKVQLAVAPAPEQLHAGEPTNLLGRRVMLAVAEPVCSVVPTAVTVMVSV